MQIRGWTLMDIAGIWDLFSNKFPIWNDEKYLYIWKIIISYIEVLD